MLRNRAPLVDATLAAMVSTHMDRRIAEIMTALPAAVAGRMAAGMPAPDALREAIAAAVAAVDLAAAEAALGIEAAVRAVDQPPQ